MIIKSSDVPPSNGIAAAEQGIQEVLPGLQGDGRRVPLAQWGTKIAPDVQSAVGADPNLTWITPLYDSMALFAQQAITAAGKVGKVHIASYNGTPAAMKLIQSGGKIMAMDVGENIQWLAYATVDQVSRAVLGAPIIANGNEETPLRIFTAKNIAQAGNPPGAHQGYGTAYVTGYDKLWGVKCGRRRS